MAIRITGRSQLSRNSLGRPKPHLRYRKAQSLDRLGSSKVVQKRYYSSTPVIFGPLTLVGVLVLAGSLILIAALSWFFVFGQTFLVKEIELSRPTTLTEAQIVESFYKVQDQRILGVIPGNHILFLSPKRLLVSLQQNYPYIDRVVDYQKMWPQKIAFSLTEKKPVFTWAHTDGMVYSLDEKGMLLYPKRTGQDDLVVLEGRIDSQPEIGKKLLGTEILDFALDVQKKLAKQVGV